MRPGVPGCLRPTAPDPKESCTLDLEVAHLAISHLYAHSHSHAGVIRRQTLEHFSKGLC